VPGSSNVVREGLVGSTDSEYPGCAPIVRHRVPTAIACQVLIVGIVAGTAFALVPIVWQASQEGKRP
jgi:hypothetical protein